MLRITACCNSGILLEYEYNSILIDGVCADYNGFTGLSSELFTKICRHEPPFVHLQGFFFSHEHPDHFDKDRAMLLNKLYRDSCFFIPDRTEGKNLRIQCGPFSVLYSETPHMSPCIPTTTHGVFLIQVGPHCIYYAADAEPNPEYHLQVLAGVQPDYIFANFLYLASEDMVDLLQQLAPKQLFITHLPADTSMQNCYRRKAVRCIERLHNKLPPVMLINRYPMRLI